MSTIVSINQPGSFKGASNQREKGGPFCPGTVKQCIHCTVTSCSHRRSLWRHECQRTHRWEDQLWQMFQPTNQRHSCFRRSVTTLGHFDDKGFRFSVQRVGPLTHSNKMSWLGSLKKACKLLIPKRQGAGQHMADFCVSWLSWSKRRQPAPPGLFGSGIHQTPT